MIGNAPKGQIQQDGLRTAIGTNTGGGFIKQLIAHQGQRIGRAGLYPVAGNRGHPKGKGTIHPMHAVFFKENGLSVVGHRPGKGTVGSAGKHEAVVADALKLLPHPKGA